MYLQKKINEINNYKFKEAVELDFPFIKKLHEETLKDYIEKIWGWNQDEQDKRIKNGFKLNGTTKIITLEEINIGLIAFTENETEINIENILIRKDFQKKGIGKDIFVNLINIANRKKVQIKLSVFKINPAEIFYKNLGFIITGEDEIKYYMLYKNFAC